MASLAILPYPEPAPMPMLGVRTEPATFSAFEWSIVAMARGESLSSLRPAGPVGQLGRLLGVTLPTRLADERLETLRRTAVSAWHRGYVMPTSQVREFLGAGFTLDHYELLQTYVGNERAKRRGALQ